MKLISYNPSTNGTTSNNHLMVAAKAEKDHDPGKAFIQANTIEGNLEELKDSHIIPVFPRDNEPLISQVDFIDATSEIVKEVFHAERILKPVIRLSHPVKGRVPDARNKPASELESWEKTLYYERMAFLIEVDSITDVIDGERLALSIGGIKAYNLDNLSARKGVEEHFKIFIGFKVRVCCNMCIWTDGFKGDIRVKNIEELRKAIYNLLISYDAISGLKAMTELEEVSITEGQFANLIGKCKMYHYLPKDFKKTIPELQFGDNNINAVCRDYYQDRSFCRNENGEINLWRLYNLFTSTNKGSYIDCYGDRAVNASSFIQSLSLGIKHKGSNWFLE